MSVIDNDDNREVIALILNRLKVGIDEYGHGFRVDDDTTQYGTEDDSWVEMALEEAIDMILYLSSALLRIRRNERDNQKK